MRTFRHAILLALVAIVLNGCDFFKTRYEEIPPEFPDTPTLVDTADLDWKVRTLEGDTISLQQFAGKKMFINIWGSWCQPCLVEMPKLQALYDELKGDTSIVFLFVSDEPDSTVRAFAAENTYTLPFFVSDAYKPRAYNTGKYPTTIIVNSKGEIVYRLPLTADWSDPSVSAYLQNVR